MNGSSPDMPSNLRARLIGLGERSFHKSYYPELRRRVTELQETQAALQESESRFQQLVQALNQVFWLMDWKTKRSLYVSPAFDRIWGQSFDRFWDQPLGWMVTIVEEDLEPALRQLRQSEGQPFAAEFRIRRPDGTIRWIRDQGFPVRDASGEIVRMAGVAEDITPLKEAADRLQQAKTAAENANAAKDRFMAALSHELRTPLTPVLLTASVLQDDPSIPEQARLQIAEMRRHVEMEARLIDDLLDLTRITAGKLELEPRRLEVHGILDLVLNICRHDLQEKELKLQLQLDADCCQVEGDAARLQQVFWNLIKNAVKFTPPGGTLVVRSRNVPDSRFGCGALLVEVEDTGIGMDATTLSRIFSVFQQGSREITREYGGLGMGLSISKAIVEMHHGTITAASNGPGLGSRFAVTLPCASVPAEPAPVPQPRNNAAVQTVESLRILLVEDHEATGKILKRLLQTQKHAVTLARDVRSARSYLLSQPFDLLISDIGLPDGSGWELAPLAKERGIPARIALSGFGMDHDIVTSRNAGFSRHLTKPVDFAKLKEAIAELTQTPARAGSA